MHKVIAERPRWNPGPSKRKRRANRPDELQAKFESIRRPHGQRKGLSTLLGPLKRWLLSRTGRPWNKVYSEACSVIDVNNGVRANLKTLLLECVERNTVMHEGQVCLNHAFRGGQSFFPIAELLSR